MTLPTLKDVFNSLDHSLSLDPLPWVMDFLKSVMTLHTAVEIVLTLVLLGLYVWVSNHIFKSHKNYIPLDSVIFGVIGGILVSAQSLGWLAIELGIFYFMGMCAGLGLVGLKYTDYYLHKDEYFDGDSLEELYFHDHKFMMIVRNILFYSCLSWFGVRYFWMSKV